MGIARTVLTAALIFSSAAFATDKPREAGPDNPGAWPEQLAGEWSVTSEAILGPGQDPVRHQSRATARWLGAKWLVAESTGQLGDRPFTWILTLGYDPHGDRFVATWIDTMQTHLWSYTGTLDERRTALTLETEGPVMGNPGTTASYREIIEVADDGHWSMRSMILGPEGEWFQFARTDFRREP